MILHREYALLSNHCYLVNEATNPNLALPQDWECLEKRSCSDGFLAVLYRKISDGELVLAFRGTSNFDNLITGAAAFFKNHIPDTFIHGVNYIEDIFNRYKKAVSVTGHSLGAALAELVVCYKKFIENNIVNEAVTFESPGTKEQMADEALFDIQNGSKRIIAYLAAPNAINTLNSHVSERVIRLFISNTEGLNWQHVLGCVGGSLSRTLFFTSYTQGFFSSASTAARVTTTAITTGNVAVGSRVIANTAPALLNNVIVGGNLPVTGSLLRAAFTESLPPIPYYRLIVANLSAQIIPTIAWLLKQHSIINIINEFDENTGFPKKKKIMSSWPKGLKSTLFSSKSVRDLAVSYCYFHPENRGIHNLFYENEMYEARIRATDGYLECVNPNEANMYNNRGVYYYECKNYQQALNNFTHAYALDNSCETYRENRESALKKLGSGSASKRCVIS